MPNAHTRQDRSNNSVNQRVAGKLHPHLTKILNRNSDPNCQGVTPLLPLKRLRHTLFTIC